MVDMSWSSSVAMGIVRSLPYDWSRGNRVRCFIFIHLLCAAGRAGCWRWLQGDFRLVRTVERLCKAMRDTKWQPWLASNPLNVNVMNQLVAHCVCQVPITRQQAIPSSGAAGATGTWQDLERPAGIAYIVEPGLPPGPHEFPKSETLQGELPI